jgi:glycosyltransferase involved in cell wall biosynthesis
VHVVVPDGVDDPDRPSGGNTYDRRVCDGLNAAGWRVLEHVVAGTWPRPATASLTRLAAVLAAVPDGSSVLVDGLVASAAPEVLVPAARRLRLVVLLHMPLRDDAERAVLAVADAVVVTSGWTHDVVRDRLGTASRVHVAEPGVDFDGHAPGTPEGGQLLCVSAVTKAKGHDVLLTALAALADARWRCVCVGSLRRDPGFASHLARRVREHGLQHRVVLIGPRTGEELRASYAAADVLVHPSRGETYGMVVADALARGLPVIATTVGGLPDTVGQAPDGGRPGLLVPPGDPAALSHALRRWLEDPRLRRELRSRAAQRRETLTGWDETTNRVARVLSGATR